MISYLDFEKPVAALQGKIEELEALADTDQAVEIDEELLRLQERAEDALTDIYGKLTPWQRVQIARHQQRPHFVDYVSQLVTEWMPLAGDRQYGEDCAVQAGFGRINGQSVAILGQEKGSDTASRLKFNFGMARPEGYRKAVRIMDMADRFDIPVISFVDTVGAYPGIGAEERGQAEAIARSTEKCLEIGVPNLSIIIGEGGSGGAIAIATTNRVVMLENSIYSVISPEPGAAILFRDAGKAKEMATAQKITSGDLIALGIVDEIIAEPVGGAHRHSETVISRTGDAIAKFLKDYSGKSRDEVRSEREAKFLAIGRNLS